MTYPPPNPALKLVMHSFLAMLLVNAVACTDGETYGIRADSVTANHVGILGAGFCKYATVGAAVAAASSGDTILVEEGLTIYEQIGVIAKDLVIRSGTIGCGAVSSSTAPHPVIDAGHLDRVAKTTGNVTFQQISLLDGSLDATVMPHTSYNGAGLWIAEGNTTLIDAAVTGAVCNAGLHDFDPHGAGIDVASGASLVVRGNSLIAGNRNWHAGAGGIYVHAGGSAVLEDQTLVGLALFLPNVSSGGAGGVMVEGTFRMLDDAQIVGNSSDLAGGGLYVWNGGVARVLDRARIANNTAPAGGGVMLAGGQLIVSGSPQIANNIAALGTGGGIYINDRESSATIAGASITGNSAADGGGGIQIDANPHTSVHLVLTTVDRNTTSGPGGGIADSGALLDIAGSSVISNNMAGTDGGGIYLTGHESTADLDHVTIDDNHAARGGGVIALAGAALNSVNATISTNHATSDGGGVFIDGNDTTWDDWGGSNVTDNTADRGAGIHASGGTITADYLGLRRNTAVTEGGGARVTVGAELHFDHGKTTSNVAGTAGGGFAVPGGVLELTAVDVTSNAATTDGGGAVITRTGRIEARDVWFVTNSAGGRGGGIAVLSYEASTDPQLVMAGDFNVDGCVWRGTIGANDYCSEIRSNTATGGGGGLYLEDGTESVTRTAIRDNTAPTAASAVWMREAVTGSPALASSNLLIASNGNAATVNSVRVDGGMFLGEAITSANNRGTPFRFAAGTGPALLQRSIVWDALGVDNASATPLGASCTMFRSVTGATAGTNIAVGLDPMFVSTGRGYYRLGPASANAVDQCTLGLSIDLDHNPRPVNSLYDRGAFERQ